MFNWRGGDRYYDENGVWRGGDPEQDPNVYDPINNPGGSGTGLPVAPPYNAGGGDIAPGPAVLPPTPNGPGPDVVPPVTTPTDTPPPAGSTVGPFTGQFSAPTARPLPAFPAYAPPPAFAFNAPTPEEAKNDPGYQFRVQQGNQGLQAWAAARGTLNDTGTATALDELNQNEATQEYANVWNRDWQQQSGQYMTNYQTQYADPYQFGVQGYSAQAPNVLHQNDMDYQHAWDAFLNQEDMWKYNTTNALAA